MPNVKISQLNYVEKSGFTPNDLYVLVNYQEPLTGETVHTTITDIKDYILSGLSDNSITAFTYTSNTFTIFDSSGNTFNTTINDVTGLTINGNLTITGDTSLNNLTTTIISATTYQNLPLDVYTTGFTFDVSNYDLTILQNGGSYPSLTQNLSILASDLRVTGGTYNPSNGEATFTNNSGGTFIVTGFITGFTDFYTTGATILDNVIYFDRNDSLSAYSLNLSAFTPSTDIYVTGFTYTANTFTIFDNSGNTFPVTIDDVTGLTVNGNLTASTISATTFYGDGSNLTGISSGKVGSISGSTFSGTPKKSNVVFTTPYSDINYAITITGEVNRSFTWESKTTTGFTINANADTLFTENVDWITLPYNNI